MITASSGARRARGEDSPADRLPKKGRAAHTTLEAINLAPSLYLAVTWLVSPRPAHCDEPSYWSGYTTHGVTYANPCDMYSALSLAAHPLHLVANVAALGGAIGVLTKCFWADDFVLKQYVAASGVGLLGSLLACTGCLRLYWDVKSYEDFIEAQPPDSEWHNAAHTAQSEHLKGYMQFFLLFFLWDAAVLCVRAAATALAVRHEYFGEGLRSTLLPASKGAAASDSAGDEMQRP